MVPLYQLVLTLGANRGTGRKPLSMGKDGRRWKKARDRRNLLAGQ